ncbi:calcium-dependent secretion activator 1-like, partial [Hyaena hyaena]|uniref:calcium-dependent secretion activator 1-like n=1 Tax=Hyaena hyaena TaxID=95912 RepID=UPI001923EFCC
MPMPRDREERAVLKESSDSVKKINNIDYGIRIAVPKVKVEKDHEKFTPDPLLHLQLSLKQLIKRGRRKTQAPTWAASGSLISKQQLQTVKDRFQAFLNGETQIVADEAFMNAVQSYYEVFLKSDRVARMVQSGGCSANDSREVFKKHIEKRVRSLPEIDGLSKETVLSSWMAKFDAIYRGEEDPRKQQARMTASAASELILSKEQLYEMFQNILGIKKFEHQLLYNACQ